MAEAQSSEDASSSSAIKDKVENVVTLRPLNMEDMRQAISKVVGLKIIRFNDSLFTFGVISTNLLSFHSSMIITPWFISYLVPL